MNTEIMKDLSKKNEAIQRRIDEFMCEKDAEKNHATHVAELFDKAYDNFLEKFKLAIGKHEEEHEETEDGDHVIYVIKNPSGKPVYEYSLSVSTKFDTDEETEYEGSDGESYTNPHSSEMSIRVSIYTPISDYWGKCWFNFEFKSSYGDDKVILRPEIDDQMESHHWYHMLGISEDRYPIEKLKKIQNTDSWFRWNHFAEIQLQMLILELSLVDFEEINRYRIGGIPYHYTKIFDILTKTSDRDAYYYKDIDDIKDFGVRTKTELGLKMHIHQCAALIRERVPIMDYFKKPEYKKHFVWLTEDARRLGLHEDQLIISEFTALIQDSPDKWEL